MDQLARIDLERTLRVDVLCVSPRKGAIDALDNSKYLDTPRLVADAAGTTVWRWDQQEPFGDNIPDQNPNGLGAFDLPLRFPGQRYDEETRLAQNWNRDYWSEGGRYIQFDPVGLKSGVNGYLYVQATPLALRDPMGLGWLTPFGGNLFDFGAERAAEQKGEQAGKEVAQSHCENPPIDTRQACFMGCIDKTSASASGFATAFQDACQIKCVEELSKCRQKRGGACPVPGA